MQVTAFYAPKHLMVRFDRFEFGQVRAEKQVTAKVPRVNVCRDVSCFRSGPFVATQRSAQAGTLTVTGRPFSGFLEGKTVCIGRYSYVLC